MVAETSDALKGVALAEQVAESMGWEVLPGGYIVGEVVQGGIVVNTPNGPRSFDPLGNHNHAAEVRAEACRRWPGFSWTVYLSVIGANVHGYKLNGATYDQVAHFEHESECVAICRVFILACEKLGTGG